MTLNPGRNPVPATLVTPGRWRCSRRPGDNLKDYEAVMASKALLREWGDSPWPEDNFSLRQNAEDLTEHIDDFEHDLAYGFSIFTPDESRLIGSLYLDPVAPFIDDYAVDEATAARLSGFDVRLEYWLRRGTKRDFEEDFVWEVSAWLEDAWRFRRPVFGSRREMTARRALYEALGLKEVAVLEHKSRADFTSMLSASLRLQLHRSTAILLTKDERAAAPVPAARTVHCGAAGIVGRV